MISIYILAYMDSIHTTNFSEVVYNVLRRFFCLLGQYIDILVFGGILRCPDGFFMAIAIVRGKRSGRQRNGADKEKGRAPVEVQQGKGGPIEGPPRNLVFGRSCMLL
tara:strand:+ start:134 stop:454 length:321 start_codon:yes stop_codon:yes gene_type:complete